MEATWMRLRGYRTRLGTPTVLRLAGLGLLAVVLLLLLVGRIGAATNTATQLPASGRLVGHIAPDLTLPLWNGASADPGVSQGASQGASVRLAALQGHPVVLNFWEASCDPCREEAPLLEGAWRTYQPKDVRFLGVALETGEQDGLAFLQQHGITYPNGPAKTEDVAVRYALIGTPVTIFIDRHGVVVDESQGQLSAASLQQGIGRALG